MPTLSQKVDLLYKKLIAFKSLVNVSGGKNASFTASSISAANEAYGSKSTITTDQIWTQSKYLPLSSNPLNKALLLNQQTLRTFPYSDTLSIIDVNRPKLIVNGKSILQRLDLELSYIPGSTYAWKYKNTYGDSNFILDFGVTADFKGYNILPFSFEGSGTVYRYQLYSTKNNSSADATWSTDYTLTNEVAFGANDWFFDNDSCILNFLDETLPSGITTSSTLYIRCYRYIGSVGDFATTTGSSNTNSIGDWQDSVLSFLDNASSLNSLTDINFYYYVTTNFSSFVIGNILKYNGTSWIVYNVNNNDRFILKNAITLSVYNTNTDVVNINISVSENNIVSWWSNTVNNTVNSGWVSLIPNVGWFTSIDSVIGNNNIYRYNGTTWLIQQFEQTIPVLYNKNMNALVTVNDGDLACNIGVVNTPTNDSYVQVTINGVNVNIGNGYTGGVIDFDCLFVKDNPNITLTNLNTGYVEFASTHNISLNDYVILITNTGIYYKNIVVVNANNITYSPANIAEFSTIFYIYLPKTWANIQVNDKLLWFGSYAQYQLDANDTIDYMYVSNNVNNYVNNYVNGGYIN